MCYYNYYVYLLLLFMPTHNHNLYIKCEYTRYYIHVITSQIMIMCDSNSRFDLSRGQSS